MNSNEAEGSITEQKLNCEVGAMKVPATLVVCVCVGGVSRVSVRLQR